MEAAYMITPHDTINCRRYALTGHGWRRAMELVWPEHSSTLNPILGNVMAALKSYVTGRHEDAWVHYDEVAQKANVEAGFVYNIIET